MTDPNEIDTGASAASRPDDARTEVNQPASRPYGDAGDLYDIPRVRPDDPPMRRWWIDDEPHEDGHKRE